MSPQSLPAGTRILLAVGRLVPAKGFDILIAHFSHLAALREDVVLVVLGEGPERSALAAQIAAQGLTGRVILAGAVHPVTPFYHRADCLVMTSRWEGMPMVLLEAMAAGLPVVVSDFGPAAAALVCHNSDGLIVAQSDRPAWCEAINVLLDDERARTRFGAAARAKAAVYQEDVVIGAWQALITQTMALHRQKPATRLAMAKRAGR